GIELDVPDDSGQTPLFIAATNSYVDIAKFLFRKGADLNHENDHGMTPLHATVQGGHVGVARFFL
ncbi:hypothetical protein AOQ84DRAFT_277290, partial [Glonium stellatum]